MKKRHVSRLTAIILIISALFFLTSCNNNGNPVSISVNDSGNVLTVEGRDIMTVAELLESAGITLKPKDIVTPNGDTVLKESGVGNVIIQRYARVTVTDGESGVNVEIYDGTVLQALDASGYDMTLYSTDADVTEKLTDGMTITLKKKLDGFVTADGKDYFYKDNEKLTNAIVEDPDGVLRYTGEDGVIDYELCAAVNIGGEDWNVLKGVAAKVETDSDRNLNSALKDVAKCTDSSMTKKEKLKAAFDFLKSNYLEGSPRAVYTELDWPVVYAQDIFVRGKGDCYSYGAAFAYMGKALGCSDCYAVNSGGHGWAEIEGLIYDPEWSNHSKKYPYFAMSYDDECDVAYKSSISDGAEWKRIAV